MVDLHCHVLPGLDDGPATMDEALELLAAQAAAGVDVVAATSHVNRIHPGVTVEAIAAGVRDVAAAAAAAGIDVTVVPGAEVAVSRALDLDDDELAALHLGAGGWLLLEPPLGVAATASVERSVEAILARGHQVLLAHPERCPAFQRDPAAVERLVAAGARCSVTASALSGAFGRIARRCALGMLERGLVCDLASDAHGGTPSRPAGLRAHLDGTGYEPLADWLCEAVPRAIVTGEPLPAPPAFRPPRARGVGRLRRRAQ